MVCAAAGFLATSNVAKGRLELENFSEEEPCLTEPRERVYSNSTISPGVIPPGNLLRISSGTASVGRTQAEN